MKKYINHILLASILSLLTCTDLKSEDSSPITPAKSGAFTDFYFGIGLAGTNFFKDTPSWVQIQFKDIDNVRTGGSFDGVESGLHLSFVTNLDSDSRWMLPINFEYNWLSAGEDTYITKNTHAKFKHNIDVQKIGTGIQWNFYTFQFQDVNAYMGAEFKAIFINNQKLDGDISIKDDNSIITSKFPYSPKPKTVRFGSEFKLGFRGELTENFFINSFLGIEIVNLLGKDDSRGELFTPLKNDEVKEQYVGQWHFVLMIEYKL